MIRLDRSFATRPFGWCCIVACTVSVAVASLPVLAGATVRGTASTGPGDARRVGSVAVVRSDDTNAYQRGGTIGEPFSLRLPGQATCPGDSANDDWRVQTFIVPADRDPGVLAYTEVSPVFVDASEVPVAPLFDGTGSPFVNQLLGANTEPGQPGRILGFPVMSFARLPESFVAGTYRIGVSCTRFRSASQYWDTEISVSGAGAERTWKVVGKMPEISGAGGKQSGTLRVIGIVLAAAGLFALGMLLGGRRRRPASSESEPA